MMRKTRAVYLSEDVKNSEGIWLSSWNETESPGNYIQFHTLSGKRYRAIKARCTPTNKDYQKKSENCFGDFQEFTEWSKSQIGYNLRQEDGKFWAIDKDIFGQNSKIYSTETCIFVPQWVNNLVLGRSRKIEKSSPLGVSWSNGHQAWQASCAAGKGGNGIFLGFYNDPYEAHLVWQKKRFEVLVGAGKIFKESHPKLYEGIMLRAENILNDINSNTQTFTY